MLIPDEPFSSLDPTTQVRLKNLLQELPDTRSVTMLISSHNLNHVTEVCERIAVLEEGYIVRDTETNDSTLADLETYFMV